MANPLPTDEMPQELMPYWAQLNCKFPRVAAVFPECLHRAQSVLSAQGLHDYIENARFLGKMGRGAEPLLIFLEEWPEVARVLGEAALEPTIAFVQQMTRSPNGPAIVPFLQSLPASARRLETPELYGEYLRIAEGLMTRTTGSVHGIHQTFASPGLPELFKQTPFLLAQLSLAGLRNWVDYGIAYYNDHPERQIEYFSLQSADSRAVLQRERHGTLLQDHERKLDLLLRGLWRDEAVLHPYPTVFVEAQHATQPWFDAHGIRLPDVCEDCNGVAGLNVYRAMLAHIAAHRRYSRAIIADNLSVLQRFALEVFEDSRVEYLAMREYPGLRRLFLALHPQPKEDACAGREVSAVRHRLAMLSRAILDGAHPYQNERVAEFAARFHQRMQQDDGSTQDMVELAVLFIARTAQHSDYLPDVHFEDTEVPWRDDNRHLWLFIEEEEDEDAADQEQQPPEPEEPQGLPPRHYAEWDYRHQQYRPDWVTLYEGLHPQGKASDIDKLLEKHAGLSKRLKKLLDLLKPQDKVRIRYQEEGSELDLDVALRSIVDYRSGAQPDPRINMSHRNDGRNIAVMVLLDLSASLNEKASGSQQTILELSQEAVTILAWAVQQLGDPFAIAGFHSNTRHDVRYLHIKGYSEPWDDTVKSRLAAMQASYSTRMGAAMRHAAHYLAQQQADKKLMLILTDGEPADIDSKDGRILIEDAKQAVHELDRQGIYSYCINLDAKADEYVADIFGRQYTIVDNVAQLPEKLPELFISLTK
ncbi:nitric oxide reductase activation protein NorD [Ferrigenium sp. UT5]|uniref:nitric oxide reductase activation protein NorD n=1 Tax=Ferrigenium sp. UT5 TaxID=3242105 RepID=UPI003550273B